MHTPPIPNVESSDPQIAGLIHDEARRQYEKASADPVGELRIARRA